MPGINPVISRGGIPFAIAKESPAVAIDEACMLSVNSGISTRSVAELALLVSRLGQAHRHCDEPVSHDAIRIFWQSNRQLQQRWTALLARGLEDPKRNLSLLEQIAPRLFVCEMLVRTWATCLSAHDKVTNSTDLTRVCRNIVSGLFQLRLEVLSRLVSLPEEYDLPFRNLDRLRRQCDRSTDLLVSMVASDSESFEFAFDRERASDFHESTGSADAQPGHNPIEDLVSAGLRMNFIQQLSDTPVDEPEFAAMMQSILANLPNFESTRNQRLLKSLEWKIATSLC